MLTTMQLQGRAMKHWRRWRPEATKEMETANAFRAEMLAIAKRANRQYDVLRKQGYMDWEAEDMILRQFILVKPEPGIE